MQVFDFSGYLLKGPKIIFIDKSTTYKKLEVRVLALDAGTSWYALS